MSPKIQIFSPLIKKTGIRPVSLLAPQGFSLSGKATKLNPWLVAADTTHYIYNWKIDKMSELPANTSPHRQV
jgi:hypothetical protein